MKGITLTWREGLNAVDEFNLILVNECRFVEGGVYMYNPFPTSFANADDDLHVFLYACHLGIYM